MKNLLLAFIVCFMLTSCKSFGEWWNAPVDGSPTIPIGPNGEGGTYIPPEAPPGSDEPIPIGPGGQGGTYVPPSITPPTTRGQAISQTLGGIAGALLGNPAMGTVLAAAAAAAIGKAVS